MSQRCIDVFWLLAAIPIIAGCSRRGSGPPEEVTIRAEEVPDADAAERRAEPDPGGAIEITSLCPTVVAHLASTKYVVPKHFERQPDVHAQAIISLGKAAGPCLVEKITDTAYSQHFMFWPWTLGDLARYCLCEIYRPDPWPSSPAPFDTSKHYRTWDEYNASPEVKAALKEYPDVWRSYVATHRD